MMLGMTLRTIVLLLLVALASGQNVRAQESTTSPHGVLPKDLSCTSCHRNDAWSPLLADPSFDHSLDTAFPLDGQHMPLSCISCHESLRFDEPEAIPSDCETCHETPHTLALSQTCAECHSTASFQEVAFEEMHWSSEFELIGTHEIVACETCHSFPSLALQPGIFTVDAEACISCHSEDYQNQHGQGFPETCLDCHNQSTWEGASFDHLGVSGFELIGAHEVAFCTSCHVEPGYDLVFSPPPSGSDDCLTCHQSDYDSEHGGSNFPTTCLTCHNQSTWDDATFSHPEVSNGFELIGAHEITACASCHTVPSYDLVFSPPPSGSDDCLTCHQSDYDSEHGGSGFPITCLDCHNQSTWDDASFDHDAAFFPIYSGEHRGEWSQCSDCHRSAPVTFATFSCVDCHEHRQSEMDDEHDDVNGYVWESLACYSCHPDGRE
jgi:hypothetical protein